VESYEYFLCKFAFEMQIYIKINTGLAAMRGKSALFPFLDCSIDELFQLEASDLPEEEG
jgi:hypothetical protein